MTRPIINIITAAGTGLPKRAHPTDACVDLTAAIDKPITLYTDEQRLIDTGIRVHIEPPAVDADFNWVLEISPRSGLANKHGITITNSPGIIDQEYTGKIMVILKNTKERPFVINPGDRIAQMKLTKSYKFDWYEVDDFAETLRGAKGFGSTGVK